MDKPRSLVLNENHKRCLTATLRLLDRTACELRLLAERRGMVSVLYHEHNNLPPPHRISVASFLNEIQAVIGELREVFGLDPQVVFTAQLIRSYCSSAWEQTLALHSRQLRGYGELPPETAAFLNPKIEQIADNFLRLSDLLADRDKR
ncbi:MAG TPA: hypothetical protein PK878_09325 [bacterium]|nr:hypothetical protein [bacterium]HOL93845.1 hypothetical protein [bacterium]HPP01784.1 hypothetical protein [bacterium]